MRPTPAVLAPALLAAACALTPLAAPMAEAATLGVFTRDYGSAPGRVDPGGNDVLSPGYVTVSDQSTSRFFDSFDFSALSASSIDSLTLTLSFSGAGPSYFLFFPTEIWSVRIQGSTPAAATDDHFTTLSDALSPQTVTLSAATDGGGVNAFAQSLASGQLAFWFSESSLFADAFRLTSASLTVEGTPPPAPVPLPAGGLLLLGALGGLAARRRRG
jgi:hypothetical protein